MDISDIRIGSERQSRPLPHYKPRAKRPERQAMHRLLYHQGEETTTYMDNKSTQDPIRSHAIIQTCMNTLPQYAVSVEQSLLMFNQCAVVVA
jgi:hypothetical protein